VIAATRLRKGNVACAHGAATLIAEALATLRRATTPGLMVVRADSAYFTHRQQRRRIEADWGQVPCEPRQVRHHPDSIQPQICMFQNEERGLLQKRAQLS
jgi:hypothetical protein